MFNHVDVVGVAKGPSDTVLVTLQNGGVIQHSTLAQKQIQTWALGGSASRNLTSGAVYVRSRQDVVHIAAVLQERKRNYLCLWDQKTSSVSEGTKHPISSSGKAVVFAVESAKRAQYFLVASYDGKLAKLEPGSDLAWLDVPTIPEGADVVDVKLACPDDTPSVCYLYREAKTKKRGLCVCRLMNAGKTPVAETVLIDHDLDPALELGAFEASDWVNRIGLQRGNGGLSVLNVELGGSKGVEDFLCSTKALTSLRTVFLTLTQLAIVGVAEAAGKASRLVITIVDTEYKLLLHQYTTREGDSLSRGEALVGVSLVNEDTLVVATNRKQFCFKLTLLEMSFSTVLGAASNKEKNAYIDFEHKEGARPTITTVPAEVSLRGPVHEEHYDIYEREEMAIGDGACQAEEVGCIGDRFTASDLRSAKTFLAKLKGLLDVSSGTMPLLSEAFVASLWDECVKLKCWEGVTTLVSHKLVNHGSHVCKLLRKMLDLSQPEQFEAVLGIPATVTDADLYEVLDDILGRDTKDASVQSCLMAVVGASTKFSAETVTGAVRRLGTGKVVSLVKFLSSEFKAEVAREAGVQERGEVAGMATFASSVVDAHLTSLLMVEEAHETIEDLHTLVRTQIQYERTISKLANLIKHLGTVEPLQDHGNGQSKDFTVEILNISC